MENSEIFGKSARVEENPGDQARKHLKYVKKWEQPADRRPLKTVGDADIKGYARMKMAQRKKALTTKAPVK